MNKFSTDFAKQKFLLELQKGEISAKNGYIDIDTVEKMLRRRLEYMKNRTVYIYTPENYEEYIAGAEVYIFGNYALLLATPNNAKAIEILRGMID